MLVRVGSLKLSSTSGDRVAGFNLFSLLYYEQLLSYLFSIEQSMQGPSRQSSEVSKLESGELKRKLIEVICKASSAINMAASLSYLSEVAQGLLKAGCSVWAVDLKLEERGLFGASSSFGWIPFELGLNFDWVLNMPYIPASSIKGAVRGALQLLCQDDKFINKLLGSIDEGASLVIFSGAYPIAFAAKGSRYLLYPDVLTPHYTPEVKVEHDVAPNPLPHLVVAPGVVFRFLMAFRERDARKVSTFWPFQEESKIASSLSASERNKLLEAVVLAAALGIGAKTNIGYSRLSILSIKKVHVKGENVT